MKNNIIKLSFSVFFLAMMSNIWADVTIAGINVPDKAQVAGKTLVLNGAGIRTKLFHKVYVMGLYVPADKKSQSPNDLVVVDGPRLIVITMVRNVDAKTFIEALKDGLEDNNSKDTLATLKPQIDQLEKYMLQAGQAKIGNVIKLEYNPAVGTNIYMNSKKLGTIDGGTDFYSALLKIWLGKESVDGDLKISLEG
jgi:hypothetical protein